MTTNSPVQTNGTVQRRLRPLHAGLALQGTMLWLPVEKLFMTQIGFTAASVGLVAAAYAAVTPLLEVPTGILPLIILGALTSLTLQVIFEFGPLWLVALSAPAVLFGPYWASLMSAGGLGGLLAGKIRMTGPRSVLVAVAVMLAASVVLNTSGWVVAVIVAQVVLVLLLGIAGIHVGAVLHDAVPSAIRAGVASGTGTISWIGFLPFALAFGWVTRQYGVHASGWMITAAIVAAGGLLLRMSLRQRAPAAATETHARTPIPAAAAC